MNRRKRLAIIGGGSSGLICLKFALERLPDWDIQCFEQTDCITGAWGNPYPGFVSTSTKYTTQFACYPIFDAGVQSDGGASRSEFFRDGEYGQYLEDFAREFSLTDHILLRTCVEALRRAAGGNGWELTIIRQSEDGTESKQEHFDTVIICTGLAAQPKSIECDLPALSVAELTSPAGLGHVTGRRIVVIGGGESAVDYANRLARAELNNEVYLSLHSGVRVSPRYHPIRGVPSDFLRNRLMLSIHEDLRNWIGQRFVELRIRYQKAFERLFPHAHAPTTTASGLSAEATARRKDWDYRLTKAAKDDLFNMFHNKSDDFLDAVAEGRIQIIGPAVNRQFRRFRKFDSEEEIELAPDLVVPAIGYQAKLGELSAGQVQLGDFYLGCCHVNYPDLYLVGFARPIIGNIPSISEMQARYVCGLIASEFSWPADIEKLHRADIAARRARYDKLNMDAIFPVEMFPYCDQLARLMGCFPTARAAGSLRAWWWMQLAPATTIHYGCKKMRKTRASVAQASRLSVTGQTPVPLPPIYMPPSLVLLLLALKPIDWAYRLLRLLA